MSEKTAQKKNKPNSSSPKNNTANNSINNVTAKATEVKSFFKKLNYAEKINSMKSWVSNLPFQKVISSFKNAGVFAFNKIKGVVNFANKTIFPFVGKVITAIKGKITNQGNAKK